VDIIEHGEAQEYKCSLGLFHVRTARELLLDGFVDALLQSQGTGPVRPLISGWPSTQHQHFVHNGDVTWRFGSGGLGVVPGLIEQNNVTNPTGHTGWPVVTHLYNSEDGSRIVREGLNVTQYHGPKKWATGALNTDAAGSLLGIQTEDIANFITDVLYEPSNPENTRLSLFRGKTVIGGSEGLQYPGHFDIDDTESGIKNGASVDLWMDELMRVGNLKRIARSAPDRYGVGIPLDVYELAATDGVQRFLSDGNRKETGVEDAVAETFITPECMRNLINLQFDTPLMWGKPGYLECANDPILGVSDSARALVDTWEAHASNFGEAAILGDSSATSRATAGRIPKKEWRTLLELDPVTGRVHFFQSHYTSYVMLQRRQRIWNPLHPHAVTPLMSTHTTLYAVSKTEASTHVERIKDLRSQKLICVVIPVLVGFVCFFAGCTTYCKARHKYRQTQLIYPADEYTMRLEARRQVLIHRGLNLFKKKRSIFKEKSRRVKEHKKAQQLITLEAALNTAKQNSLAMAAIEMNLVQSENDKGFLQNLEKKTGHVRPSHPAACT